MLPGSWCTGVTLLEPCALTLSASGVLSLLLIMAYLFLVLLEAAAAEETDVDARSSKAEAHCADDVESPAVCRLFSAPFGAAVGEMVTLVSAGQQSGWLAGLWSQGHLSARPPAQ